MTSVARTTPWLVLAALLVGLPFVFTSDAALTTLTLMAIMIVFSLSYNMLLGQTGLMSLGHAVYYGLAGFIVVHLMNTIGHGHLPVPLVALPAVGAVAGLAFGVIFGWFSTKHAGTAFAMITLGMGELVVALSPILVGFFGGEEGVDTNRTALLPLFGWNFGPQMEVYCLAAGWCFISIALMYAITRTPFGRICNAVRDNPERVEYVGYNARIVRFIAFSLAGLFAGIAGALGAVNFEIMNASALTSAQSGTLLLMTYIGGTGEFFGPIIGAALITFLQTMLSDVTQAWLMYFGIFFILVVMYMPGGFAGWLTLHAPVVRSGHWPKLVPSYLLVSGPLLLSFVGAVLLIELSYHVLHNAIDAAPVFRFFVIVVNGHSVVPWLCGLALLLAGAWTTGRAWPKVSQAWLTVTGAMREGTGVAAARDRQAKIATAMHEGGSA